MRSAIERAAITVCYHILVIALAIMFVLIFGNVVLRFVFNSGVAVAEEIARLGFVWCTFLGAVLALHNNAHIGIAGIRPYLSPALQKAVEALAILLMLLVCVIMLIGSIEVFWANRGGRTPIASVPIGVAYSALVVGATAMGAVFVVRLLDLMRSRPKE